MTSYALYLAIYTALKDERLHHTEWIRIQEIINESNLGEEVGEKVQGIFEDRPDKIQDDYIVSNLSHLEREDKVEAICLALTVGFADGKLSEKTRSYISEVATKIGLEDYEAIEQQVRASVSTSGDTIEYTPRKHGKIIYKLLSRFAPVSMKQKLESLYRDCLLSGYGYEKCVEKMKVVAHEDIEIARQSYASILPYYQSIASSFLKEKTSIKHNRLSSKQSESFEESSSALTEVENRLGEMLKDMIYVSDEALNRKEESLDHYTISFLGRTKAGKSTLHSVILCGRANEFIGVGKERTTRYNRVYRWNGIEIIDTPGIAAPDGQEDERIAASVIDESDLICFVVSSDSEQPEELAFLQEIKDQNKPVLIILNKKDNIRRSKTIYDKFIQKPLDWYNGSGAKDIEGHINRIKKYVNIYYKNPNVEICPIHLLAAKLSLTAKDSEEKSKLWEGSRMKYLLDNLRINILNYGIIRRSQTILDGTIYHFNENLDSIEQCTSTIKVIGEQFKKNKRSAYEEVKKAGLNFKSSLIDSVSAKFDCFAQHKVPIFAANYREQSGENVQPLFESFCKNEGFDESISAAVNAAKNKYLADVEETLKKTKENLNFSFGGLKIGVIKIESHFSPKKILEMLGGILGLAAFWYPPLFLAGLLFGVVSLCFKSRDKKLMEAEEKLKSNLISALQKNKEKTVNDLEQKANELTADTERQLARAFDSIIKENKSIEEQLQRIHSRQKEEYDSLNIRYAMRIINFLEHDQIYKPMSDNDMESIKVDRNFGKHIYIQHNKGRKYQTNSISRVLQEEITTSLA